MHWERTAQELIEHLKMQVAHQIESAIDGGGLIGKYSTTPAQRELDAAARAIHLRPVSKLTKERAEEIAEENRRAAA